MSNAVIELRALCRETLGDTLANAAAGACHDNGFVMNTHEVTSQ